ncbi:DegV family protein [Anoxybacillus rupiensis]|uniref:DegV family protein n=1 Tax=Anoxybacteroides rupiense TaxID=311460 RepID=A0ABT5W5M7_9BACL|nr:MULTISPECIES: DegV family protein [Anoxybacillus]KXG09258.1 DegV domain-containing protein [Anoxybacillus sp. P3H1B]MBS2772573.1 DegV family protein [Anoxybacillus rupiensis]MDE8564084.1 DegV family protein [Anoxybacillus rupiensis]QHC03996.1 DegV family EDD domain-containing protein [Anoxybacillus sp. PDR2]
MSKIKIVTDSTVDVPTETLNRYGIEVIPLTFTMDNKVYTDRLDITSEEFMKKMAQANELPKSSQPSIGSFLELYNRLGEDGCEILSIHMAGALSGTVQSARQAAAMSQANVAVVDSQFISLALGFQVIEAAKQAAEGKSCADIIQHLEKVRCGTHLYIAVDTLDHLVKGGRIGRGKALLGSLLNIKPIAALMDGIYTPVMKARSYSQIVSYFTQRLVEDATGKTIRAIGIAHADALTLANRLRQSIVEATGYEQIDIVYTTPIVSIHTGAGAIGFMYYVE